MPRGPRGLSERGFYHVIMRGAGKQVIFDDDADYEAFLRALREALGRYSLRVLAWCLMSNHVHLLVDDPKGELSRFVHLVSTMHARHFNSRWGHVGHVFSSRFTSVAVDSDAQLRKLGGAGLSVKQIGRLTGLGRYAIEKALHQKCV